MKTKIRPKPARRSTPIEIPLPLLRATYLKAADVKHYELAAYVHERFGGKKLSRPTISAVLDGRFRNEQVIEIFSELTGTDPQIMWPEVENNATSS